MDRAQKAEQISQLNEAFGKAGVVVVARYQGMTVADMSKLRSQMRAVGASFKVSKNRLAKRATEGTSVTSISDLLKGPTGIAISADPISAPKVAVEYAKTNAKFVILGGVADPVGGLLQGRQTVVTGVLDDDLEAPRRAQALHGRRSEDVHNRLGHVLLEPLLERGGNGIA